MKTLIANSSKTKRETLYAVMCLMLTLEGLLRVSAVDTGKRVACYPLKDNLNEADCNASGCLWETVAGAPPCFLPGPDLYGYEINGPVINFANQRGFTIDLRRRRLANDTLPPSLYGGDFDDVTFEVNYYNDNTVGFAIYPKGMDRIQSRPPANITEPFGSIANPLYTVQINSEQPQQPFNFQIIRKSSDTILFDTSMGGLTISEQFLMITTKLPSPYLYGFGENNHDRLLHDLDYRMWPIWARDHPPGSEDSNEYGAHPFYVSLENDGSAHGVWLFNSHAMDVTTMPNPGITIRTIGGVLEFFMFLGPQPESVVQQFTSVVGMPFIPPYFALGFQLSRWGYKNTDDIRQVVNRNRAVGVPQDVAYADIDYMDGARDFTIDPNSFADLPKLVDDIKAEGVRFVVILDPAIAIDYDVYARGKAANVFIKWANSTIIPPDQPVDGDIILGDVWPANKTAFPDFFKDSTKSWWTNEILSFYGRLKFDALWIDMNEVSNSNTNLLPNRFLACPINKWDDPVYPTMAATITASKRLSDRTICLATKMGPNDEYLNYDVHSLYGHAQSIVTQRAAQQATGKRSMVLSRSTFTGSGTFAGHWLGDNYASWNAMADSIIGIMEFNLFGIPYVGADICGFALAPTEEMCERWMELGAFYPFSRNHNIRGTADQDPAHWPDTVAVSSRKALNIRYRLLPYLYTLFYDAHTTGSTVARPLYHEFPRDVVARHIDRQFLWGSAFMISPVLDPGKTTVDVYIPDDVWYDYYTGARVLTIGNVTLDAPRDYINLHVRGGSILPAQKPALNTMLSRRNNFELLVALKNGRASGRLFWDDGESMDTIKSGDYQINTFDFITNILIHQVIKGGSSSWQGIGPRMDLIQIMGWPTVPGNITVNGVLVSPNNYTYDQSTEQLLLHYELDMNGSWFINFQ